MTMDFDFELLRQTFLAESEEGLAAMEEALIALEADPDDLEPLQSIFRTAHTLKGSSAMVGFDNVAEFSHLLEDGLEPLRTGATRVTELHVTLLLRSVDALREIIAAAANGHTKLRASDRRLLSPLLGRATEQLAPRAPAARRAPGARGTDGHARSRTLRVHMDRLDQMLDLTGEVVIARGRLAQLLAERSALLGDEVISAAEEVERLFTELQGQVMSTRMVPLGPVFRQYVRTARDLALACGKRVRIEIHGEDVELDTSVLDHLRDPLTHMVRNAIDHGLELPAVRRERGKDAVGRVSLRARHEGGSIVIELSDDGGGLNRDRILARARERGLVAEDETPPDRQLFDLIFEPGFSTADAVTELSGRGVGMDVVRSNVEAIHGSIAIDSRAGEGTTLTLRLPLTLAIIEGFAVGVGAETYIIPLDSVLECLQLPPDTEPGAQTGVLSVRDEPLPFVRLRELFGFGGTAPGRESVIVVQQAEMRYGLVADTLYGNTQAVVKPLDRMLRGTRGVSSSTVLGNGGVALIIDVPDLVQHVFDREALLALR